MLCLYHRWKQYIDIISFIRKDFRIRTRYSSFNVFRQFFDSALLDVGSDRLVDEFNIRFDVDDGINELVLAVRVVNVFDFVFTNHSFFDHFVESLRDLSQVVAHIFIRC